MTMQEKKLERLPDQGVITGVAAGVADYVGIDPTLVRIIFVVGAFFGLLAVVLYIVLYFVMPVREGSGTPPPPMPSEDGPAS